MYTVENKFEIGEECYSVYRKPTHYKCPICEGNGKFPYKGYEIWCKNCSGSGKLHNPKQSVMAVCKVKVRRLIASIWQDQITIKYKVDGVDEFKLVNVRNRGENNLFKTKEELLELYKEFLEVEKKAVISDDSELGKIKTEYEKDFGANTVLMLQIELTHAISDMWYKENIK